MFDPSLAVKVAADDVSRLRRQDVFRVIEWAPAEFRQTVAQFITNARPDIAGEVAAVLDELA